MRWPHGAVAQLGERLVRNEEVRGSIPLSSIKKLPLGVTGNTPDSGSGESWFEPRRGNGRCKSTGLFLWGSAFGCEPRRANWSPRMRRSFYVVSSVGARERLRLDHRTAAGRSGCGDLFCCPVLPRSRAPQASAPAQEQPAARLPVRLLPSTGSMIAQDCFAS